MGCINSKKSNTVVALKRKDSSSVKTVSGNAAGAMLSLESDSEQGNFGKNLPQPENRPSLIGVINQDLNDNQANTSLAGAERSHNLDASIVI